LSRKALRDGLYRAATMAPMKSAARTLALPPPMKLLPRHWPDWRVQCGVDALGEITAYQSQLLTFI
jgi:hypothetical protein